MVTPPPLVWVGFAAFFVVSLWVGLRLVALWLRTGRLPELLIGVGVLGIGPVGFGFQTVALIVADASRAEALAVASALALALGVWAKLVFNWLVYRRGSRPALAALVSLCLAVGLLLYDQPRDGSFLAGVRDVRLASARGALQAIALGWGALEALIYWRRLKRRLPLGLADPVIANRFALWGLAAGAACLGTAIGVLYSALTGHAFLDSPAILASSSVHGLVAACSMWLAFVPPRRYVRWIAGDAATAWPAPAPGPSRASIPPPEA